VLDISRRMHECEYMCARACVCVLSKIYATTASIHVGWVIYKMLRGKKQLGNCLKDKHRPHATPIGENKQLLSKRKT